MKTLADVHSSHEMKCMFNQDAWGLSEDAKYTEELWQCDCGVFLQMRLKDGVTIESLASKAITSKCMNS